MLCTSCIPLTDSSFGKKPIGRQTHKQKSMKSWYSHAFGAINMVLLTFFLAFFSTVEFFFGFLSNTHRTTTSKIYYFKDNFLRYQKYFKDISLELPDNFRDGA